MFRHSLRVRLLLPVLALVFVVVVVVAVVLAVVEANRVRAEADASIRSQTTALQSLFAVTRSIMLDRVHDSMRLLRQQSDALGTPDTGPEITVAGRSVADLRFGNTSQSNDFRLVDGVTATMEGTATIFSSEGDDFVRVATNVKKDDGSRAIGTVLDPQGPVIEEIRKGRSFYGVVDILGTPYVTGYEPIYNGKTAKPVGIWYVGYKTDLQALDAVVSDAQVLQSGFIAVFDSKGKLRFQSKTGATVDPAQIERVAHDQPADWVVDRQNVPDWGFSLVSAYPKSDINSAITRQSILIGVAGLLICVLLLGLQSVLIWSRVLQPIQRLTTVAEDLSMGKWHHQNIEETKLNDEIGTLARAISRLSNSVRLAMERLNKR
ncbi:Cache 3/Cache 2 fusion domain-containing protein [Dyella sedimenti]|uniref:Cache 3/Cache 2 fusion domain-containing protein n=1 Tax=Dyella sedimenti TaxID=2919947 RepID=UPI001FA96606|nr:Cache 3/Cache 2 fusion domain-containing protein [Dyella sedimenti]